MKDWKELDKESVERIKNIEYWSQSLSEFERYKRQAYEVVSHERDLGYKFLIGRPLLYLIRDKDYFDRFSDLRETDWNSVDAIVQFSSIRFQDDFPQHYLLSGIPVRKAKGKRLKNFILQHYN